MNSKLPAVIAAFLLAVIIAPVCYASDPAAQTTQKTTVKSKNAQQPSLQEQIEALRQTLQTQGEQINRLKSDLQERDARLKQAEQAATDAKAAAAKVAAATMEQQQSVTENTAAVSTLKASIDSLQVKTASATATNAAQIVKTLNLDSIYFKGISITPYGFFAGESAYRSHATGGELATPFSTIPYENADSYSQSEFALSGRATRIGLTAEGKTRWGFVRGRFEGDFLAAGTMSNPNQSSSYVFRQRVLMAEAETNNHWTFSAGQGWTLASENVKGISTAPTNIAVPQQIDPNYLPGYVWYRGGNYRVTKGFQHVAIALSAENPQILYTASLAGNTPYAVLGTQGASASFLNSAVSSCSPSTMVVSYSGQGQNAVPTYKTLNSCANLGNIAFNQAPDILVKVAFDPGYGHYEIYGISRFAHETIYPGETTNSNLYGSVKDIVTGTVVAPALTTTGSFNNKIVLGGMGASMRLPLLKNKLIFGAKGMYGAGVGRYSNSTLADATSNAWGGFSPVHNTSGLFTLEANLSPRLLLYAYYGGDYASRVDFGGVTTTTLGAPVAMFCVTGTNICTATPTAAQVAAGGAWGAHWNAPTAAAVGYGSRLLSNSACAVAAAPGYNSGSTGYYPGGSCGAQTRDMQEATFGYWYDIYKGDRGRIRQGIQYGYVVREGWSGAGGVGAKGIENMFFTSFRYYLP